MSLKAVISGWDWIFRIRSDPNFDSEPNAIVAYNGRQIIDADTIAIVATAQIQLEDIEESEAEERLFHS